MTDITFKPSLLIKLSGIASLLAIPLSAVIIYLIFHEESSNISSFNYFASWFLAVALPLGNAYVFYKGNWSITLKDQFLEATNNLIFKELNRKVEYKDVTEISMKGMLSKSVLVKTNDKLINIPNTSLHVSGNLPDLKFNDGALHGPTRDLYKLKFELEQRCRIEDKDPFPPYIK
ncbi:MULTISPECIES: hypothetical protein [unclassified Halobacteriovorax]|uniref:hypothetical protein n=1 Tax=unclassified Halobacteriovorax TaxID=2639665 RepID=UPI003999B2F6